jgi:dihydropteroate synthase
MADRDLPTAVVSALLADAGLWGVRVHNVAATTVALETRRRLS